VRCAFSPFRLKSIIGGGIGLFFSPSYRTQVNDHHENKGQRQIEKRKEDIAEQLIIRIEKKVVWIGQVQTGPLQQLK
jgi:hypothetical protein